MGWFLEKRWRMGRWETSSLMSLMVMASAVTVLAKCSPKNVVLELGEGSTNSDLVMFVV